MGAFCGRKLPVKAGLQRSRSRGAPYVDLPAMAVDLYDQELDFSWVEHVSQSPVRGATEERAATEWHAPSFICKRELPSRRRSLLVGIGGAIDFLGMSRLWSDTTFYRIRELPPNRANALAIYGDWCAVGGDLHGAVKDFERTELEHVEISTR